jgi:hypothetical protein
MESNMKDKHSKKLDTIDIDAVEEVREGIKYALECRSWDEVEDVLELLNDILEYDFENEEDEGRNHLEE